MIMNLTIKGRIGVVATIKKLFEIAGLVARPGRGKDVFNTLNQVLNIKLGVLNT